MEKTGINLDIILPEVPDENIRNLPVFFQNEKLGGRKL